MSWSALQLWQNNLLLIGLTLVIEVAEGVYGVGPRHKLTANYGCVAVYPKCVFVVATHHCQYYGKSNAEVAIVNTGVAITRVIEEHPVNINTFASEIVLPSYERMDEVVLIKVA